MFEQRITVLVGHFGSGKTEIALNGAVDLAGAGENVSLVDLDVVKPYFRSRSAREWLKRTGVELVAPQGENAYADLPIVVPQVRSLIRNPRSRVIVDVGGNDSGSRVLGSLADVFPRNVTDLILVLNFRRPFTETVAGAVAMAGEITRAARLPVTGVVSNTHLLDQTSPEIVREGYRLARQTAEKLGVPVKAVAMEDSVKSGLGRWKPECPIIPIGRLVRPPFEETGNRRETGPLFVLS